MLGLTHQLTDALDAGDTEKALALVAACPSHQLNELDQYGFPPITRATLNDQEAVIQAILQKGGIEIDKLDRMGRTALYWAVESDQPRLIRLFLKRGANPNHYDGSRLPMLAYPLLRRDEVTKQLLVQHGANLSFAQDVIYCKLLGHRFELPGRGFVYTTTGDYLDISFEGFIPEFSLQAISQSLTLYTYHRDGQRFTTLFPYLHAIADALNRGFRLRQFRHHHNKHTKHLSRVRALLDQSLIVLPITYEGHAISMLFLEDLFAKCDRGEQSHIEEPVIIHQIGRPAACNKAYFYHLLYDNLDKHLHQQVYQTLALTPLTSLPTSSQIVGNCSWANTEATVLASLWMQLWRAQGEKRRNVSRLQKESLACYHAWQEWDKDIALDLICKNYLESNPYRQRAMATLLVSVLGLRLDPKSKLAIERAKQIITVLKGTLGETLLQNSIQNMPPDDPQSLRFIKLLKVVGYQF